MARGGGFLNLSQKYVIIQAIMENKLRENNFAFTLLEILLVVAAIAVLAGVVIVAINPARQLAASRNSARQSDSNSNILWIIMALFRLLLIPI